MARAAAILAVGLQLGNRFLDDAAADLVAAVADADRRDAVRLGVVRKMVRARDLVRGARRSHDRMVDALAVGPDLFDEDHRRGLPFGAQFGGCLLAGLAA